MCNGESPRDQNNCKNDMKKIPTLFRREFSEGRVKIVYDEVTSGLEWVLKGEGQATVKIDGSCCAIMGGEFYRRYDAKRGKVPPAGAIPCCDPDPITGHWPHWLKVDPLNGADNWHLAAYYNAGGRLLGDGTYEAIGPHFQSNPHHLAFDILEKHGIRFIKNLDRSFEGIRRYLSENEIEGIVFWKNGEPQCKIKRSDFGFKWPVAVERKI